MKQPLSINHVITGLQGGGAERMLARLVATPPLAGMDHRILVLKPGGPVEEILRAGGTPVYDLSQVHNWIGEGPKIFLGWMYHGCLAAHLIRDFGFPTTPLIWNIRASLDPISHFKPTTRAVIKACVPLSRSVDQILYNAYASQQQHEAFGFHAARSLVIPNGFDLSRFRPEEATGASLRRALGISSGAFLIGLVARVHPMKDHSTFLRAFSLLCGSGVDAHAVLIGAGADPGDPTLAPWLGEPHLLGRVHCLGAREDLPFLTSALDVAVSSSLGGEGFSNALGEAMACGIPCVATAVGDASVLLEGVGTLVPPEQPNRLAGAMQTLFQMGHVSRRLLGAAGRDRVTNRWSLEVIAKNYATLFEAVWPESLK